MPKTSRYLGTIPSRDLEDPAFRVLQYLFAHPWSTAEEIAEAMGETTKTTYKRLSTTNETSLRGVIDGDGGRPERFAVKNDAGALVGLDLGTAHWRVAVSGLLVDLGATSPRHKPADVVRRPLKALDKAAATCRELLAGLPSQEIAGVAIGVPFTLRDDGTPLEGTRWQGWPLPDNFLTRLKHDAPAAIESDVCLGAIAELQAARDGATGRRRPLSIVYTKWSSRLNAALIVDDQIHRGDGLAGSFVHTPASSGNAGDCDICGRPCAASLAGLRTLIPRVNESLGGRAQVEGDDAEDRATSLCALAERHDEVSWLLAEAARAVGASLGHAANVLAADAVIVGGAFRGEAATGILPHIGDGFDEVVTKDVHREVKLVPGRYTGSAAVTGALALAEQRYVVPFLWSRYRRQLEGSSPPRKRRRSEGSPG